MLRVPDLVVEEGETLAVLGPNGAGKSTLLLTAALLLPVTSGTVSLFDEPAVARDLVRLRRQTATVFQEPALLDMNVRRNLETALALHGLPRADRRARSEAWLARLGVAHLADAMPHALSGGEARRVSLARAFAVRPRVIFLDEPFSSLDLETRTELVGDLRSLLREEASTALLVTHDHSEAQLLADRSAVLIDGVPVQVDDTQSLFARPASPAVATFLGYSVIEAAQLPPGLGIDVSSGTVAVPPSAVRLVAVPPSAVRLVAVPPSAVRLVAVPPSAVRLVADGVGHHARVVAVQGAHGRGRLLLVVGEATLAASLPIGQISARGLQRSASVSIEIDVADLVTWDSTAP